MMKNRVLFRTNSVICLLIITGFIITAVLAYQTNYTASIQSVEQVSILSSEGIYYQMNNMLSKPVNISQTMASDSLLKALLEKESNRSDERKYLQEIQEYLSGYKSKYQYDSVFLVSQKTKKYYNFNGLDRVLNPDDEENKWYYESILGTEEEYTMNIDNDEVAGAADAITLFVNCKISGSHGELLGVVGVGVRVDYLQTLLQEYQEDYGVNVFLVNESGEMQISTDYTGYEGIDFYKEGKHSEETFGKITQWKQGDSMLNFWETDEGGRRQDYLVVRYLPELSWHLVVERQATQIVKALRMQMILIVFICISIIAMILLITTHVIRKFNREIISLTLARNKERKSMFERATEELFEDIYEIDITNNRPANQKTRDYFVSLGAEEGISFDAGLHMIAEKQIKEEFREEYLDTFSTENVQKKFESGIQSFQSEFMIRSEGEDYYWMRITTQLVVSELDGTLHMLVYRQNIHMEKCKENQIQQLARVDQMTGILNKTATQYAVDEMLRLKPEGIKAFFMFDIDHFKDANDWFGHTFGDEIICCFTSIIQECFTEEDVLGRVGGDEFVAFFVANTREQISRKAEELRQALCREFKKEDSAWTMSTSIGIAISPQDGQNFADLYEHADVALYAAKKQGRNRYSFWSETESENGEMT